MLRGFWEKGQVNQASNQPDDFWVSALFSYTVVVMIVILKDILFQRISSKYSTRKERSVLGGKYKFMVPISYIQYYVM